LFQTITPSTVPRVEWISSTHGVQQQPDACLGAEAGGCELGGLGLDRGQHGHEVVAALHAHMSDAAGEPLNRIDDLLPDATHHT